MFIKKIKKIILSILGFSYLFCARDEKNPDASNHPPIGHNNPTKQPPESPFKYYLNPLLNPENTPYRHIIYATDKDLNDKSR